MTIFNQIKVLIIAGSLMVLSACSPNSGNNNQEPQPVNDEISRFEAKSGIFSGNNDFGIFPSNATSVKLVTFTLKNDGTEPLIGPAVLSDTSAFDLTYSNCPASLAVKKSCMIKVTLDPKTLAAGSYTSSLSFDTAQVSLVAIKESPAAPTGPDISYSIAGSIISSLDFGNITDKQNVLKTITIKNISSGSINDLAVLTGNFVLNYDSCSNKNIAKNSTCSIKITLNGAGKSGDVLGNLSYGGLDLPLLGNVTTASGGGVAGSPNIIFLQNNVVVSGTVSQGDLAPSEGKQVIVTVKNSGTLASAVSTAVSNNSAFQIVANQCSNRTLAINASCQVRVLISGQNTTVYGEKTADITFAGASIKLSINILDPGGIATYVPEYSDYGSCSAANPCDGYGLQNRTIIGCQKMINNSPVAGGTLADCNSFNTVENLQLACPSPNGNKTINIQDGQQLVQCNEGSSVETIVSTTCNAEFHEVANACMADVITYTATFSDYGSCSAMQPCDGQGLKYRTIDSCQKYRNGMPEAGGQVSDCSAENTSENLQTICDSPAGNIISDIFDQGTLAGFLTITCSEGGILPGTNRVATCDFVGFEQDGEQCIKLNTLQVTKSLAAVGSISVSGLDVPILCDTSCSEVNAQIRRDKNVNISFTANESNQYAFDSYSGDSGTCVGNECNGLSLDAGKILSINTHERKLVVMQETAGYTLSATGTGLFVTTAPVPTAGFTQAKAYYVEENNNFGVSISVVGGSNVNTGWYIDDVKQAAPIGNSVSKIITANTTMIHATTGPNQQVCGNTVGDYFGVAAGQGSQAWNATTGLYATRCIPNNASSCIVGSFDDHGTTNNYMYRTATLFPASDSQDPDPSYPYAQGACVKNSIYCGDGIPNVGIAVRNSFGGENLYDSCFFDCQAGYRVSGGSCVAKQLFVIGSTGTGNDLHKFNFDDNSLTKVSSIAAGNGLNLLTVDQSSPQVYLQHSSTGLLYKYDLTSNTNTAIMAGDNLASQINNAYVSSSSGFIYFIASTFSNGVEIFRSSINGTSTSQPTMLDVNVGTGGAFNGTGSIMVPSNGWVTILRSSNATIGTEIALLNPSAAWNTTAGVVLKDLVAGTGSSIDTAVTQSGVGFDSYTYFVGTNTTVGTEIFRVFTSNPATANYVNMANVAAGATGSSPGLLNIWNSRLFYKATVANETELYYTSNLTNSTANFTKIELVPGSGTAATGVSSFNDMKLVNGKMYVSLSRGDNTLGQELYVINESPVGTFTMSLVADINPTAGSAPRWFETDGKNLYFLANNGTANALYMYDGTTLRNLSAEKGLTIGNPAFGGLRLLVK